MTSIVSYKGYSTDNNNNNNKTNDLIKKNVTNDLNFKSERDDCIKKCKEDFKKEVQEKGLRALLKFNESGMPPKEKRQKRRSSINQRALRERKKKAEVQLKLLVRNKNKCIERCEAEMEMKYLNLIMKQKGMDEDTEGLIVQYLLPKPNKSKKSKTRKSSSKTKKKGGSKSKKKKSKSPSKKKGGTKRRKKGGTKRRKKGGSKTKKKSSSK